MPDCIDELLQPSPNIHCSCSKFEPLLPTRTCSSLCRYLVLHPFRTPACDACCSAVKDGLVVPYLPVKSMSRSSVQEPQSSRDSKWRQESCVKLYRPIRRTLWDTGFQLQQRSHMVGVSERGTCVHVLTMASPGSCEATFSPICRIERHIYPQHRHLPHALRSS